MISERLRTAVKRPTHPVKDASQHFFSHRDMQSISQKTDAAVIDRQTGRTCKNLYDCQALADFKNTPAAHSSSGISNIDYLIIANADRALHHQDRTFDPGHPNYFLSASNGCFAHWYSVSSLLI